MTQDSNVAIMTPKQKCTTVRQYKDFTKISLTVYLSHEQTFEIDLSSFDNSATTANCNHGLTYVIEDRQPRFGVVTLEALSPSRGTILTFTQSDDPRAPLDKFQYTYSLLMYNWQNGNFGYNVT
jgi:hypothetical protein